MSKQYFSSRLTAILTMLGVAIGLGNVWRFPYMMGSYGGSAFLIVYLAITVLLAIPALMAEMALGRMSGQGTVDALRRGFGKRVGGFFGYLLLIVVTVSGSYYAVIVGNVLFTTWFSLSSGFEAGTTTSYHDQLSNGPIQYLFTVGVIVASLYVISKGLTKGIEYVSKIVMPLFFVVLIYMIIHALRLPDAISKYREFLRPDWSALGPAEIFAAIGQAFFSVGLGGTFVVVYAGFFKEKESIPSIALFTGLGDASASLLFSLFLVPSMLVFGLDMTSGPTLIFQTFPQLFSSMPGGRVVGTVFLLAIFIVAFLSLVAAYQVPLTSVQHARSDWSKNRIIPVIGVLQCLLALPSSLYPSIIASLDLIFGSGMQILGSVLCIIGLTWGIERAKAIEEIFHRADVNVWLPVIFSWIKWVIPLVLIAVLAGYVADVLG